MDLNIYAKACGCAGVAGHNIISIQENLVDPKSENRTLTVTKLICTRCGGVDDELTKAPKGFVGKPRKHKNGEQPSAEASA